MGNAASTELFDDVQDPPADEGANNEAPKDAEANKSEQEAEAESKEQPKEGEEGTESQGEDNAETPAAEGKEDDDPEKMIPVSRLKAAVKDVSTERDQLRARVAELEATPPPDKEKDPQGYEAHVRLETSKAIMAATHMDYDEVIAVYQEMAKENPSLNLAVAAHPTPAKYAYDIAKRKIELDEVSNVRNSPDWKAFQQWQKDQAKAKKEQDTAKQLKTTKEKPKPPVNLNRATDVSKVKKNSADEADELFADSPFK